MAFRLHPEPMLHPVFEALAYVIGYAIFRQSRSLQRDPLNEPQRWNILAAAALGALVGSRLLGILEQAPRLQPFEWRTFMRLWLAPGGKTIVGALLGGWIAVEIAKYLAGIHTRTGDLFAIPLCIGIATGRIGCFLAGLADDTCGKPTALPWAVDFGDGIPRHPAQLYEIVFLLALAGLLAHLRKKPHREGDLFRIFLTAYLVFRFAVDFLKPQPLVRGINLIQWSCLVGLAALLAPQIGSRQTTAKPAGQIE